MLIVREQSVTLSAGKIGLISDTHGLMRPQALKALRGVELILHAGDIGKLEVLAALGEIASVLAIRGNNDRQAWARQLPDVLRLRINGVNLQVIHNVHEIDDDPASRGIRAVISGHSHRPGNLKQGGVLFINPGSAGPRRFTLPVAIGTMRLHGNNIRSRIVELVI
jgi:putative phosphoesterase